MNLKLFTNRFKHDSRILNRECSGKYLYEYLRHILRSGLQRSGQDRVLFAPWQQLPPFTRFWGFFTSSTWMKNVTLPLLPWNKKKYNRIFQPNWENNFENWNPMFLEEFFHKGWLNQNYTANTFHLKTMEKILNRNAIRNRWSESINYNELSLSILDCFIILISNI